MIDVSKISGLGAYTTEASKTKDNQPRTIYLPAAKAEAFLIKNPHTIELRTDQKLGKFLREKYESVMESRYFGKNGIEIVLSGQLTQDEIADLIRLSYNLTSSLSSQQAS